MNSRRKNILFLLLLIVLTLVGYNSYTSNLKVDYKIKDGEDITFFVTTDIHYLARGLTDNGDAFQKYISSGDGKQLNYIDEIMSAFSYEVKNKKPDVLIVSGDLTNNGEKESHLELSKRLRDIESSGTHVYVIPGNHDILNPWAREFIGDSQYKTDSIREKDFSKIYKDFGYEEAISRDKNTLSYIVAPSENIWLLMLDTNKYKSNMQNGFPQTDGEISKDTIKWIKRNSDLAKSKGATIITVMHHNLIDHSDVIRDGYTLNNSKEVIDVLYSYGVDIVLSGHIHIQDISSYQKNENTMYDIATSSLAVYPNQYGVLKYTSKYSSLDYSTRKLDIKAIDNFKNISEEFFGGFSYKLAYKELIMNDNYSEEKIKLMGETMKLLNLRYFSGEENLNSKDIIDSKGFKLWLNSPKSFLKRYIISISRDKDTDDNNLNIDIQNTKPIL